MRPIPLAALALLLPFATARAEDLDRAGLGLRQDTAHFRLATDVSRAWLEARAQELEAFRAELPRALPFRGAFAIRPPQVCLFATEEGFSRVVARSYPEYRGHTAFYIFRYDDGDEANPARWNWWVATWKRTDDGGTRRELFHELTHIYVNYYLKLPPLWLDEGLAEYFETAEPLRSGGVEVTGMNRVDLGPLQAAIGRGALVPLKTLVALGPRDLPRWTDLHYNEAWSFVHFLRHGRGGAYRATFDAFLLDVAGGKPYDDAFAARILAGIGRGGWLALQQEWLEYAKGLR